ncbi:YciI family protein [Salegentibacter sp. F188]|uniref:YciI family protein n=1 Tax=Autumnicola patrickiae TaxID=3075591 RepID=A0ABU3E5M5_9FLAO|nr:YciI family protein [Salegentibacter sp. F188]MDT0691291.1 YciI family protein [Salegentibacter sp. F188]
MKKRFLLIGLLAAFSSCEQTEKAENSRGIPGPDKVEALAPNIDEQEKNLKEQGYQTLRQERGDSTYLMQQYYMVFLTPGENINQDSTEVEELQNQHSEYLERLVEQGHASLTGHLGEESTIKEVVVFNTPTQREADSLANIDPLVQSGRVKAEVYPWWVKKGAKLD